ncbi:rhomboid family intramembrane serine protease [Rhodococcus sp. X156]|uniref:rhomboid family intramembrane serine protease n=1 Tax=Rhodococcus sp. X156 TaxID=2499145 RepID=UPI000FDC900C|nr:rhomboid family intramembrane serine protease [Rhodococcus sp. X156]
MRPPAIPSAHRPSTPGGQPVWKTAAVTIALFVAALWVIQGVNSATGDELTDDGIEPRAVSGLDGILWAPLLHADFGHLQSNTVPLLVLGFAVLVLAGLLRFVLVSAIIWLVSGVGVWLFGEPDTVVVGASGLVFGYLAYLIVSGIFTRSLLQLAVGVVVLVLYGSLLWGVFPGAPGVSWQGHLFGAVGGVVAASAMARRDRAAGQLGPGVRR